MKQVLALSHVRKSYDGRVVLDDVTLGPLLVHVGKNADPGFFRPVDPLFPCRGRPGLWIPPATVEERLVGVI